MSDCETHHWQMVESGYLRTWSIRIDETDKTITAIDSEFSEEGDEVVLACRNCDEKIELPADYELKWS